ncbi:DUF5789 family protein [Natranaeroarchaeum sulfidigenes]|uniref:DUF2795 domain-containing protein n=1 Tax=Natranaeroarchaeum sulfidigenes TaxID=2784880 RepID=A0A897MXK7_9EURY|nr:hypothetical protein [Natranaeroarchaeum sulfidigenes]QSG03649.1 Uncharacterized protein AArcS_2453 [Natranaeroarchaeum sulfidigenes]
MGREVRLSHLDALFGELDYPIAPGAAAAEFDDVTLRLADGEENLGELVADLPDDQYQSSGEMMADLHNTLPRGAVGEPFQSEGDG